MSQNSNTIPAGLSRREVLAGFGAMSAVLAMGPRALRAEDEVILGKGNHKYVWVPNWAKLPEGKSFRSTHGCVQPDSQDRIYVNTDNQDSIMVFDNDGKFIKSWGKEKAGGAHGMQIVKQGGTEYLYLADLASHSIVKFTLDGEVVMTIPYPKESGVYKDKNQYRPTMVSVAPNGDIYVGDGYGKSWIHRWNSKGEYINSWNGSKTKAGPLRTPHGVWVDLRGPEPRLLVADRSHGRIVVFTMDGKHALQVVPGLRRPCKVFVHKDDVLIPDLKGRVTILDWSNNIVAHLGDNPNPKLNGNFRAPVESWKDGIFTAPHGACWDSKGNMYVEDWNQTGRVNKLKRIQA